MKLNLKGLAVLACIALLSVGAAWAASEAVTNNAPANNTYQNTSTATFSGTCTGTHATDETDYDMKLWIKGSSGEYVVFGTNTSVPNNTLVSYTPTLELNSIHTWFWECMNSTGDGSSENANSTARTITLDTIAPSSIAIGGNTPADGSYHASPIVINATCTDALDTTPTFNWTVDAMTNNYTVTGVSGAYSGISMAFADGKHNITVHCEDSAGYSSETLPIQYFYIDSTDPTIQLFTVTELANGGLFLTANYTETNYASCGAYVLNSSSVVIDTIAGTTTTDNNCSLTLLGSDITNDGYFETQIFVTDDAGNTATTTAHENLTYVYLREGWNFIRNDRAQSLQNMTLLHTGVITHVSLWSNQNYNYTSYVVGTSTNGATEIYDGDSIMVYANATGYLLRKDMEDTTSAVTNTFYYSNWNTISLYNITEQTLTQAYTTLGNDKVNTTDNTATNATHVYITHLAWLNPWSGSYESFNTDLTWNENETIPYGYALWARLTGTHQPGSPTNYTYSVNMTVTRGY